MVPWRHYSAPKGPMADDPVLWSRGGSVLETWPGPGVCSIAGLGGSSVKIQISLYPDRCLLFSAWGT